MKVENTKRDYYLKKYFWVIILITAIVTSIITLFVNKLIQ